jgi:predicted glycosyltransferase
LTDKLAKCIHNQFIIIYVQCWIPDFKGTGLAGKLSHPKKIPRNAVYIGALSRFEKLAVQDNVYDLLISLSGPEPQRTIFENIILRELEHFEKKVLVVRGLPTESQKIHFENSSVTFANHLSATDLNLAFQQSEMIICRSGYTTIMDLVKIEKKAILVPTPGQREQEYLASYLMEKKNFLSVQQKKFKLKEALSSAAGFPFVNRSDNMDTFKRIITDLILLPKSEGTFAAPQAPFPK